MYVPFNHIRQNLFFFGRYFLYYMITLKQEVSNPNMDIEQNPNIHFEDLP